MRHVHSFKKTSIRQLPVLHVGLQREIRYHATRYAV